MAGAAHPGDPGEAPHGLREHGGGALALWTIGFLALGAILLSGGLVVLLDEAILRRFPEVGLPGS